MKKVFKKFLGAMAVFSIFTGSVGVSAFYSSTLAGSGINALRYSNEAMMRCSNEASLTSKELKKVMDGLAEYRLIYCEMANSDPSQWDNYLVRLRKAHSSVKLLVPRIDYLTFWCKHYSENEYWKHADDAYEKGGIGQKIFDWIDDHGLRYW